MLLGCQQVPNQSAGSSAQQTSSVMSSSANVSSVALSPSGLVVRLEKEVTTDAQATVHTKATLHLTGALERTIDLGNIFGELQYVNPKAYARYHYDNADTVAAFSTWWAGQGEEIFITQFHQPHSLTVERRYGDEGGICNPPDRIIDLPLPGDVRITLQNVGEPTLDRSTIDFACTAP